ncbi:hypothetical protein LTR70_005413 [Exophiala xenobiotica]|uniref:Uncharacterized protein n=1 Tax=Lithohypha guttulata TaxID=1690604 RepID=A0ABR0K9V9_9EURO|nr:hypothetical protein LTR24_005155 [Lithohypha guttulata]KAK5318391.1 hypothetical protein LTR70_005413 [Exophiala xenobiotica]
MAAILNGLLPSRKKDHSAQDRILNTRWGDAAISAPIHGGWSANGSAPVQFQSSPDLDRDLPPTPPHNHDEQDGIYIVREGDGQDSEDENGGADRENITITIPLPWKKKKTPSHTRKSSLNGVLNPRFAAPGRTSLMPPPLATAEAAAIPLPESRISSPVGRTTATSPILSFRSRLASPNLADILSPVAEGFAKEGPSSRHTPVLSSLQYIQTVPLERPPTAGSLRSSRRSSLTSYNTEGTTAGAMSSQGRSDEQPLELSRPPSRGLGATAHMRASSRGPRANSRGPVAPSVEPLARRAPSVEPLNRRPTPQVVESVASGVLDLEPVRRRAPSVEPARRRAPSIEPLARRAPSVEPSSRQAPSTGPTQTRRAVSREPRGRRRDISVGPAPKVRFHSEAPRPTYRPDSFSSNDGSVETESDNDGSSESEAFGRASRFNKRRPHRRRSIASPITSPTTASFTITQQPAPSPRPAMTTNLDSIAARAGLTHPTSPPLPQRSAPRNRSQSRTRGLYAEMHDDFRLLGRDVHIVNSSANQYHPILTSPIAPSPIITQAPPSVLSSNSILQHMPSPVLPPNPTFAPAPAPIPSGPAAATAVPAPERTGYTSDSSLTGLPSVSNHNRLQLHSHSHNHQHIHFHAHAPTADPATSATSNNAGASNKAMLAALAYTHRDQLRREERERVREKVARRLEREKERAATLVLSDCESVASGHVDVSGSEKTRRVYGPVVGAGVGAGYDSDATTASASNGRGRGGSLSVSASGGGSKTLVPSAEEIWG